MYREDHILETSAAINLFLYNSVKGQVSRKVKFSGNVFCTLLVCPNTLSRKQGTFIAPAPLFLQYLFELYFFSTFYVNFIQEFSSGIRFVSTL